MATSACCRVFTCFHTEFKHWFVSRTLGCNKFIHGYNAPFVAQFLQMTDRRLALQTNVVFAVHSSFIHQQMKYNCKLICTKKSNTKYAHVVRILQ